MRLTVKSGFLTVKMARKSVRSATKGHQAGQFDQIEYMEFDSQGNLYVTEVAPNTRIQKFVPVS